MQGAASQVLPNECMTASAPAPCLTCPPPGSSPNQDPGPECQWAWLGKAADLNACQALATAVHGLPGRSDVVCQTATWCHADAGIYDRACYCGLGTKWTAPSLAQANTDATVCLHFGTPWGPVFLVALVLVVAVYVGGGIGCSMRASGAPARIASHPHWRQWQELRSLCMDGMAFTRSHGSKPPERGQRAPGLQANGPRGLDAKAKAKTKKKGRSSSSDGTKGAKGEKAERRGDREESLIYRAMEPEPEPADGTTAAGGGRWVHVSA